MTFEVINTKASITVLLRWPAISLAVACLTFICVANPARAVAVPRFCRVHTAQSALRATTAASGQAAAQIAGVHLLVDHTRVSPSAVIYARLANFGSDLVGYGREFQIQQLGAEGWELDPASPGGPWEKVRGLIRPGFAGRCYQFDVPLHEVPGRRRFVTNVEIGLKRRRSIRMAGFTVLHP